MVNLYNKQAKEKLTRIKKNNFIVLFVLLATFVICFILCLVLPTYQNKLSYQISGSIVLALLGGALVYFISRAIHIKSIYYDFTYIEEKETETYIGKVNEFKKELITLPDKSKVYVVNIVFKDETGKNFLISQIFDVDLEKDTTYKFKVVSDYIKGYEKYER